MFSVPAANAMVEKDPNIASSALETEKETKTTQKDEKKMTQKVTKEAQELIDRFQ